MLLETLGGSLLGGVLRLAPEIIKVFDRKNERSHEATMMDKELQFEKARSEGVRHQTDAALSMSEMNAVSKALEEQGSTSVAAGWFVAALSALVRPLVTYWFVGFYSTVKVISMQLAVEANAPWREVLIASWTKDDAAILAMILTFWFVGRVYERSNKQSS